MSDSNIEFDTDQQGLPSSAMNYGSRMAFGHPEVSGMAGWLIKKGIIQNETQAKGILLLVVVANFIIAGIVFYFFVLK